MDSQLDQGAQCGEGLRVNGPNGIPAEVPADRERVTRRPVTQGELSAALSGPLTPTFQLNLCGEGACSLTPTLL